STRRRGSGRSARSHSLLRTRQKREDELRSLRRGVRRAQPSAARQPAAGVRPRALHRDRDAVGSAFRSAYRFRRSPIRGGRDTMNARHAGWTVAVTGGGTQHRQRGGMSLWTERARAGLRRTIPWAAVGLAGAVPATIAVSMAIDLIQKRGRKTRVAPRPGTFGSKVAHSQLGIYTDGATLYEDMIAAIDSARDSILMETFIWKNDEAGQRFIDAFN